MGKPIILADNILERAVNLEATNTAADFDVAHIIDRRQYTFWKAAGEGTLYITADFAEQVAADTFGMIGHNFGSGKGKVTLQASDDSVAWEDMVAEFEPLSDKAVLKVFSSAKKRYWRLKVVMAAEAPFLAVLFLGERLEFPRYVVGSFDPAPEQIHATTAKSKAGYTLGAVIRYISYEIAVSFTNLTDTFVRTMFQPVWDEHISQLKPFFWAWDNENYAGDVFYVSIPDNFSLSMPYNTVRRDLALKFVGIKE